jgi:predicted ATPase/class 3 adenylate cyclase
MSARVSKSEPSLTPWNYSAGEFPSHDDCPGAAPTGTVTLVFTDIEGSSALWERYGEDFAPVLNMHQEIFRRGIAKFSGYEVKTEGDAFMVAFSQPAKAAEFCMDIQHQLDRAPWPHRLIGDTVYQNLSHCSSPIRGLRVRMGIHTGPVSSHRDPTTGRMDYFGPSVNRAARVSDAAHGGQILLSRATWGLVKHELAGIECQSFGEFKLKGMREREELIQLNLQTHTPRNFPGARTTQGKQTNLATRLNDFVGRGQEQETVIDSLQNTDGFVTLLGAGGIGKTRLSQEIGRQTLGLWTGGVWFVDLSKAHSPEEMYQQLGDTFGARPGSDKSDHTICKLLQAKGDCLVILDNVEQLVETLATALKNWIHQTPNTRFLVTSRERLKLEGEHVFFLKPLTKEDAIELFERRAKKCRPDFKITPANRADVEEIVEKLDCVSLAIELAAARIRVLSPARIASRLNQRFEFLQNPQQETPERQATLGGVIDWSWKLLEPWEKMALAQCSVFTGSFTLDAAEAVVDVEAWGKAPWFLDIFQALQDKSLIFMEKSPNGENRFFMFESVRLFVMNKLAQPNSIQDAEGISQSGEKAFNSIAERFVNHYAQFGSRQSLDQLSQPEAELKLQRLAEEIGNLMTAMNRALVCGNNKMACQAFFAAVTVLKTKGQAEQIIELAQLILRQSNLNPINRLRVQIIRAGALRITGQIHRANIATNWILGAAEECNDKRWHAEALLEAAELRIEEGRLQCAEDYLELAEKTFVKLNLPLRAARSLTLLGKTLIQHGEHELASVTLERSLHVSREHADRLAEASTLLQLGILHLRQGRYVQTRPLLDEAQGIFELAGHLPGKMACLFSRGELYYEERRIDLSLAALEEALEIAKTLQSPQWEASILGLMGATSLLLKDLSSARTKIERATTILEDLNTPHRFTFVLAYRGELDRLTGECSKAWDSLDQAAIQSGVLGTIPTTSVSQAVHRLHGALSGQGDNDPTVEVSAIF